MDSRKAMPVLFRSSIGAFTAPSGKVSEKMSGKVGGRKRCQEGMALPLFSWLLRRFYSDHFCPRLGTRFGQ